jgi:hypothetical protein
MRAEIAKLENQKHLLPFDALNHVEHLIPQQPKVVHQNKGMKNIIRPSLTTKVFKVFGKK